MNAKKVCRLSTRQLEIARALGMNPRKLLGLLSEPAAAREASRGRVHRRSLAQAFRGRAPGWSRAGGRSRLAQVRASTTACARAGTRQGCRTAGGGSGLLFDESRRRPAAVALQS